VLAGQPVEVRVLSTAPLQEILLVGQQHTESFGRLEATKGRCKWRLQWRS
jgi:hypothetical protein